MNEQIKELAVQAGLDAKEIRDDESLTLYAFENFDIEHFAELVRADEREAIAALVEGGNHVHEKAPDFVWAKTIAKLIRARGNHG